MASVRMSFQSRLRLKLYNPRVYAKLNLRLAEPVQEPAMRWFYGRFVSTISMLTRDQGETPFIPLEMYTENSC